MAYTGKRTDLQTSAFGDWDVAQPTPKVQLQFVYGVNQYDILTVLTGSGTVTSRSPFAVVQSGAATNSTAQLNSDQTIPYRTGQGSVFLFTAIFSAGVSGNIQIAGAGGTVNGLVFGYNGTAFSIAVRSGGVFTFLVDQNSWNGDPLDGTGPSGMTLDPTRGNVYKIQMQWLGFGNINYFVQNPMTGQFIKVHTIQYANTSTVTSLLQPSMPLLVGSYNTTNNTNISIQCPSMCGYCEGLVNDLGNIFSFNATKSITGGEFCVFNLRNNTTFNSFANNKTITLLNMSIYNAAQPFIYRIRRNGIIGGTPSFVNLNSRQSCAALDTAGTTASGGTVTVLAAFTLQATAFRQIDLSFLTIDVNPGDIITFSGNNTAAATNCAVSVSWSEKY